MIQNVRCSSNHRPSRILTLLHFLPFRLALLRWACGLTIIFSRSVFYFEAPTLTSIVTFESAARSAMVVGCRFWGDPSRCGMETTTHLNLVLSTGETIPTSRQTRTFGSVRVSRMNPGGETTQGWPIHLAHASCRIGQKDQRWCCSLLRAHASFSRPLASSVLSSGFRKWRNGARQRRGE